jgi:replicative superfamily II helicase
MSLIDTLVSAAINDPYLYKLIRKAEILYANTFFDIEDNSILITKEFFDLLRYADILSFDSSHRGKNVALKIVSLLYPIYKNDGDYKYFGNAVLTRFGNFPSLKILGTLNDGFDTLETRIEKIFKSEFQKTPNNENVFTDSQFDLFLRLKKHDHFSFSGPTSFGKSFVIESFVDSIITEGEDTGNIVILVPTRALIGQVSDKYRAKDFAGYFVQTQGSIPNYYRHKRFNYIFVLTPERLLSLLATEKSPPIHYLFVDEAQKLLVNDDTRAPLYYNAITIAETRGVKLFFASPYIPNSQIFLELFDKSPEESISTLETQVNQNSFFVDIPKKEAWLFYSDGSFEPFRKFEPYKDLNDLLNKLGNGNKNIIYCNGIQKTVNYAFSKAKSLPNIENASLASAIKTIETNFHKDYFLIECLRKGVGFHCSTLPEQIRVLVEELFRCGDLDFLFCTSTLLEGVNLPARNVFILSKQIGNRNMTKIEFLNLAGRAGRLTQELNGNVIGVVWESKRWNVKKMSDFLKSDTVKDVGTPILSNEGDFYTNLNNAINEMPFTNTDFTYERKKSLNGYANVLYAQEVAGINSVLRSNFIKIVGQVNSEQTFQRIKSKNHIKPFHLLQSIMIKPRYQESVLVFQLERNLMNPIFPLEVTFTNCLSVLKNLHQIYNWLEEESQNLLSDKFGTLQYVAYILNQWMNSVPINQIIENVINEINNNRIEFWESFLRNFRIDIDNPLFVNELINAITDTIDKIIRFKLNTYIRNYFTLLGGNETDSENNWSTFIEYGTTNIVMIALQEFGLSRQLSSLILDHFVDFVEVQGGEIYDIDFNSILAKMDATKFPDEAKEIKKFSEKDFGFK